MTPTDEAWFVGGVHTVISISFQYFLSSQQSQSYDGYHCNDNNLSTTKFNPIFNAQFCTSKTPNNVPSLNKSNLLKYIHTKYNF